MVIKAASFIITLIAALHFTAYTLTSEKTVIIGDTVHMSGEVILLTDDFTVKTDTALFLRQDSVVTMPRNLTVTKTDSTVIDASSGKYLMKGRTFLLCGQSTRKKDSFKVKSDSLRILLNESLFVYTSSPVLNFDSGRGQAEGDTIEYSFSDDTMRIFNNSTFRKSGGYVIESDTALVLTEDSIYSFYHKCFVKTDSMTLSSDSVVFESGKETAKTFFRTLILGSGIELGSDTAKMIFRNDSLDFMISYRNVSFVSKDEDGTVTIDCDSIESDIEENKIKTAYFYLIRKSSLETGEEDEAEK